MIRRVTLFALLSLMPSLAFAQVPSATPKPNPLVYSDPAMSFHAPAGYVAVGMRQVDSKKLQGQTIVAAWVRNQGKPDARQITITLEPYTGSLDDYIASFESTLRDKVDSIFIDHKVLHTTPNGMPYYALKATAGSGFSSVTMYASVWADGLRGVSIVLTSRMGEISDADAAADLKNIYAVLYPIGRP